MADSEPTRRFIKPLQPGDELSEAARNSETRRLPGSGDELPDDADIFSSGSAFLKTNPHGESLTRIPPILGPYKILRPIGKGGMSRVFLAEHQLLRREVAIKILPHSMANDPVMRERFNREARAAAALDHPNIVRAYDISEADGVPFFVMEYVPGKDLDRLLREKGAFPPHLAVNHCMKAAGGLKHAHERQLIHRDVKPGNLLLDEQGTIKILDLGLARFNGDLDDQLTAKIDKGAVVCTPDFAAPEQVTHPESVDYRADIYSLGATLYTLLSGQPPFDGSVTQRLTAHQTQEAKPLRQVLPRLPRVLSDIVAYMMAKDPNRRPTSMSEVIRLLAPWSVEEAYEDTVVNVVADTVVQDANSQSQAPQPAKVLVESPQLFTASTGWRRELVIIGVAIVLGITTFVIWYSKRLDQHAGKNGNEPLPQASDASANQSRVVYDSAFEETKLISANSRGSQLSEVVGTWPTGWHLLADGNSTAHYEIQNKEHYLSIRTLSGATPVQLELNRSTLPMKPGRFYRCSVEYRSPKETHSQVISLINGNMSYIRELASTGPVWQSVEWIESAAESASLSVGFRVWHSSVASSLEIRSVRILEESSDPADGRVIYQLHSRMQLPTALTKANPQATLINKGPGALSPIWTVDLLNQQLAPAKVEIDAEVTPRNISVIEGTRLSTNRPICEFQKDHTYLIRAEYRFLLGGTASLGLVTGLENTEVARMPFAEKNMFYTLQTIIHADRDLPIQLDIQHSASPMFGSRQRNTLNLRFLEVIDLTKDEKSDTLYRLERPTNQFKTVLRGEEPQEGSTNGDWPKGWYGWGRGTGQVEFEFSANPDEIVVIRGNAGTAEMNTFRPLARLIAKKSYEVTIVYRTENGGKATLDLRDTNNVMNRNTIALNDTQGAWKTVVHRMSPERALAIKIALRNDGTKPEQALHIKELQIREMSP